MAHPSPHRMTDRDIERFEAAMAKLEWLHRSFKAADYRELSDLEIDVFRDQLRTLYETVVLRPVDHAPAPGDETTFPPSTDTPVPAESSPDPVNPTTEAAPEVPPIPRGEAGTSPDSPDTEDLADFRDVIDLNRSFVYISDLFGGDRAAYDGFIHDLNRTRTEAEADTLIHRVKDERGWDAESKAWELLLRTVARRFAGPGY